MSQPPDDSDRLVHFLQQHRPIPPSPAPDLEQRIITAAVASPQTRTLTYQRFWLIPSVMAASLLIAWGSISLLMHPIPNAAELASLEKFIENNWDDVGDSSEASDTELDEFEPSHSSN